MHNLKKKILLENKNSIFYRNKMQTTNARYFLIFPYYYYQNKIIVIFSVFKIKSKKEKRKIIIEVL